VKTRVNALWELVEDGMYRHHRLFSESATISMMNFTMGDIMSHKIHARYTE
jgi:hypothetical protein